MSTSAPRERIPPGLLVGLIGLGAGSALIWLGWGESRHHVDPSQLESQLRIGGPALLIAALAVALGGAGDLRERLPAARRGGAGLVVVGLWLLFSYEVGEVLRTRWFHDSDSLGSLEAVAWMRRLGLAGALLLAAGVLAAGWTQPRVRMLAAPLFALAVLSQPPLLVIEWLYRVEAWSSGAFYAMNAAAEVGFAALLLLAIRDTMRASGQPTARPWQLAAAAYFQAGSALTARVAIMVLGVVFALLGVVARSPEMLKVWLFGVPLLVLVVNIGLVRAILRAATDDDHDAPVVRLNLAAALTTFSFAVTSTQAILLYQGADPRLLARILDVAAPAAGLGGLLCLISAIGTVAERTRLTVTREATVRAGLLVTGVTGAAVAVQQWFAREVAGGTAADAGVFALTALVTAIAAVVALLHVARLCQQLAADLHTARDGAALPRAEARVAELDPEHRL